VSRLAATTSVGAVVLASYDPARRTTATAAIQAARDGRESGLG